MKTSTIKTKKEESMETKRFVVILETDTHKGIKKLAAEYETSMQALLNQALREFLAKHTHVKPEES